MWKEKKRDTARLLQLCRFIVTNGLFDRPHVPVEELAYPRPPPEPAVRQPFADDSKASAGEGDEEDEDDPGALE